MNTTGYFRYCVGNYHIVYIIDHEARVIDVALVGYRWEIGEREFRDVITKGSTLVVLFGLKI